jgi:hypothetical protein
MGLASLAGRPVRRLASVPGGGVEYAANVTLDAARLPSATFAAI